MKKLFDILYKIDTKKNVRVWRMEQDGSRHRTIAGIKDGALVTSGWTECYTTNAGRANEHNPIAQATFEIVAEYGKKLAREYHKTLKGAEGGAHFFKPMLAEKYETFRTGYAQPKLDGIRCIAKADGLWTRQGKRIFGAPHVFEELQESFNAFPKLILDGELYNHNLKDDFNTIVSVVKKQKPTAEEVEKSKALVQYHVYDMPSMGEFPFSQRRSAVKNVLGSIGETTSLHLVETHIVTGADEYDEFHGKWLEAGYEGSIWRADERYEQKRSKSLRKRKEFQDEDFLISKIIEGNGNWAGYAKVVEFILPDDKRLENGDRPRATIKGSQDFTRQVLQEAQHYENGTVTVQFFALTPDGIPRFPVATKLYMGKRDL